MADFLNQPDNAPLVQIIAYCLMPTHIHLIIKEVEENGLSGYMNTALKSYTRYFNCKYKRKGPLWEGRFKNVRVESDEQLIHLTRYVHLNPVSAGLIGKPQSWEYSSYKQYLSHKGEFTNLLNYTDLLEIKGYKRFVEDQIDYQRSYERIKHLVVD
jgi:putative transposase